MIVNIVNFIVEIEEMVWWCFCRRYNLIVGKIYFKCERCYCLFCGFEFSKKGRGSGMNIKFRII